MPYYYVSTDSEDSDAGVDLYNNRLANRRNHKRSEQSKPKVHKSSNGRTITKKSKSLPFPGERKLELEREAEEYVEIYERMAELDLDAVIDDVEFLTNYVDLVQELQDRFESLIVRASGNAQQRFRRRIAFYIAGCQDILNDIGELVELALGEDIVVNTDSEAESDSESESDIIIDEDITSESDSESECEECAAECNDCVECECQTSSGTSSGTSSDSSSDSSSSESDSDSELEIDINDSELDSDVVDAVLSRLAEDGEADSDSESESELSDEEGLVVCDCSDVESDSDSEEESDSDDIIEVQPDDDEDIIVVEPSSDESESDY